MIKSVKEVLQKVLTQILLKMRLTKVLNKSQNICKKKKIKLLKIENLLKTVNKLGLWVDQTISLHKILARNREREIFHREEEVDLTQKWS